MEVRAGAIQVAVAGWQGPQRRRVGCDSAKPAKVKRAGARRRHHGHRGIPVGNDQFIQATLQRLVDKYVHDLSVFGALHDAAAVRLHLQVHQRTPEVSRGDTFSTTSSREQFERFDEAVSKAMLVMAKVPEDEVGSSRGKCGPFSKLDQSASQDAGVMKHSDPCEQRYAVNVANQRMCLYLHERHPELVEQYENHDG